MIGLLASFWSCAEDCPPVAVTATVAPDMPTVIVLEADVPDDIEVDYGIEGDANRTTRFLDGRAYLIGLPGEVEVTYVVGCNEPAVLRTGTLPGELPTFGVSGESDQHIVTTFLGAQTGPAMLDPQGRVTWYYPDDSGLDVIRARLSRDGKSLLYNTVSAGGEPSAESALVRVSLDGAEVERFAVPDLAHDFVELADGTLASLAVQIRDEVRGDGVVEIDVDGVATEAWSAWDCFDPATHVGTDPESGWTLANALDVTGDETSYYVSFRNFSSIVQVDRASRACPWVLGSTAATVTPDAGSAVFLHQHQFEVLGDGGVLVMDNDGPSAMASRIVEYAVEGSVATERWSYTADPAIFSFVLGEPVRLADGDTMVDWAVGGQFDRVNPDGSVQWQLRSDMGTAFGFFNPFVP